MGLPQKIKCKVNTICNHGNHVYTIELTPERQIPTFNPGQFMHLAIDSYEPGEFWPESRVFSIASSPSTRNELSITYSVIGSFTSKMEQTLKVGSEVWAKLPYGDFVIDNNQKNIVLIAGGTGITAFTAFIESLKPEQDQRVTLFYGARTSDLLIFTPTVENKIREIKNFTAYFFVEEQDVLPNENLITGRLSVNSILKRIVLEDQPVFYVSGPPAMLKNITSDLRSQNISPDFIKTDAWE